MTAIRLPTILAAVMLFVPPGMAAEDGTRHRVGQVVDGDTVILAQPAGGADQVRLVGIQAPKLALGRPDFAAWPLAAEAKRALDDLIRGRLLTLTFGGRRLDRHGRLLAHLHDEAGTWIQGEMLRLGMARVYSFPDNRSRIAEMLALEGKARARRRGIWGNPFYALRAPGEAHHHIDTFQVIEGAVLDAAKVRGRVYLNFGPDWRTDFTVTLAPKTARLFVREGLDPLALEGRRVRVRGWLAWRNGPQIEATHPEQIEVVER
ncbi:MAG: thermonuclease family protein [Rhodospirillales bacterium]|jgi:endonuclease YncB( thermonuclease family)|nr:thermonuclease family protein [Rhodospirillales bacterium]MDP6883804.1 thermonuclease family protein [Rhodospirillales bacterium]